MLERVGTPHLELIQPSVLENSVLRGTDVSFRCPEVRRTTGHILGLKSRGRLMRDSDSCDIQSLCEVSRLLPRSSNFATQSLLTTCYIDICLRRKSATR